MKIFEYMGMGKCVVAPDQENIREILVSGRTALLFKPGSRNDMREAIQKAVRDPVLRKKLGVNARQEIFSRGFLWTRNAERAIALAEQWKSMRPVRRDLSR
jgi:glycosyltransferase involved in cell wall biosynthesis